MLLLKNKCYYYFYNALNKAKQSKDNSNYISSHQHHFVIKRNLATQTLFHPINITSWPTFLIQPVEIQSLKARLESS